MDLIERIILLEKQNEKLISYSEYLAEKLDRLISYSEYIAETCDQHFENFESTSSKIEKYIDHDPSYRKYTLKKEFFDDF